MRGKGVGDRLLNSLNIKSAALAFSELLSDSLQNRFESVKIITKQYG